MKIEFKDINKSFKANHVLKDVNFSVESGHMFGYLGRNGAGKTTSIRILMDVFKSDSGNILIDGKTFVPENYKIGYLPEERGMYAKTKVVDQLVYFAMLRNASRSGALKSVKYWAKKFQIEEYLNRPLETLSKGNQQKVQITQAFLNDPDILILDEPFSGLDPVNSKIFQDALTEYISEDRIVIFSSHQMGYIESFCDSIAIINKGEIVLKGKLSLIKSERGNNRVRFSVHNVDLDTLKEMLSMFNIEISKDKESLIISLSDTCSKRDILAFALKNEFDIKQFSDYEPKLQDIFIEMVGDHNEEV